MKFSRILFFCFFKWTFVSIQLFIFSHSPQILTIYFQKTVIAFSFIRFSEFKRKSSVLFSDVALVAHFHAEPFYSTSVRITFDLNVWNRIFTKERPQIFLMTTTWCSRFLSVALERTVKPSLMLTQESAIFSYSVFLVIRDLPARDFFYPRQFLLIRSISKNACKNSNVTEILSSFAQKDNWQLLVSPLC